MDLLAHFVNVERKLPEGAGLASFSVLCGEKRSDAAMNSGHAVTPG